MPTEDEKKEYHAKHGYCSRTNAGHDWQVTAVAVHDHAQITTEVMCGRCFCAMSIEKAKTMSQ